MALTITLEYKGSTHVETIDGSDLIALENDLIDTDDFAATNTVGGWITSAVAGKINNCRKRMARDAIASKNAAIAALTMDASQDAIISAVAGSDGYQNRAARDDAG